MASRYQRSLAVSPNGPSSEHTSAPLLPVNSIIRKASASHATASFLASRRVSSNDPVQYTVSMSRPLRRKTTWWPINSAMSLDHRTVAASAAPPLRRRFVRCAELPRLIANSSRSRARHQHPSTPFDRPCCFTTCSGQGLCLRLSLARWPELGCSQPPYFHGYFGVGRALRKKYSVQYSDSRMECGER